MTTEIQEYSPTAAALAVLREKYAATVWDVSTPERMAGAKTARAEIRKWRLDLEAERKRIKVPALERCKEIDTEAKRLTAEFRLLEDPVDDAIKEVEQAAKREKERQEREEEERIAKARAEIERIRNVPVGLVGADTDKIKLEADVLNVLDLRNLAEFSGVAATARDEAVAKLRTMYTEAKTRQEEQAKIEADRAELDRLKAEQDERDRVERERRDADEKERRERLEHDEKASRERIAKAETEAKEKRDAAEAESLAALEEEENRLRAEKERIATAARKQEDDNREAERKSTERLDARELLSVFCERYGHLGEFVPIVKAINEFLARAAA